MNSQDLGEQTQPDVARIDSGEFVVVWHQQYAGEYIQGRRFDAVGNALNEFRVSIGTGSEANPGPPAVAMDQGGSFVVVWPAGDQSAQIVYGQGFVANGTKDGGLFTVGATAYNDTMVDIFARGGNQFTVVRSHNVAPAVVSSINGYFIDNRGMGVAPSFTAVPSAFELQTLATAPSPSGRFVVTWGAYTDDSTLYDVNARMFGADGTPASAEFLVNQVVNGDQGRQGIGAAANSSSEFLIVWAGDGIDGDSLGIAGRVFDAAGNPQTSESTLNSFTASAQGQYSGARVAFDDAAQEFLVTWPSLAQPGGDEHELMARRFDENADPIGNDFQVNSFVMSSQGAEYMTTGGMSVASNNGGEFVTTWSSDGQDGFGYGIIGRRLGVE